MFNFLLRLLGLEKTTKSTAEVAITPANSVAAGITPFDNPVTPTHKNVDRKKYYRRGGSFYTYEDDTLIEDLLMIAVLTEMFDEPDYIQQGDI